MAWEIVRYRQSPEEERRGREQMDKIMKELRENREVQARLRTPKGKGQTGGQIAGESQIAGKGCFNANLDDGAYVPKEVYEEIYRGISQPVSVPVVVPKKLLEELDAMQECIDRLRDLFAESKYPEGVIR